MSKKSTRDPHDKRSKEIAAANRKNVSILRDPASSAKDFDSARAALFVDNGPLVIKIVSGYKFADTTAFNHAVTAGNIGLNNAILNVINGKYKANRSAFSTYSSIQIRKEVLKNFEETGGLIKIPSGSSTKKILDIKKQLAELHNCEPEQLDLNEIIDAVQACYPSIRKKTIKAVVLVPTQKTEFGTSDDDDRGYNNNYENHVAYYDDFESESDNAIRTKLLREAYNTVLTERQKLVFSAMNGYTNDGRKHLRLCPETKTAKDVAGQLGVSPQAVLQTNKRAKDKLSAYCRERYYQ